MLPELACLKLVATPRDPSFGGIHPVAALEAFWLAEYPSSASKVPVERDLSGKMLPFPDPAPAQRVACKMNPYS
jgi:hypothetical protein